MPKTTITYRIFIGSPSDVNEEKTIIRCVADELNSSPLIKNIKLDVIDWKSHTHPDIGEDAQDVINVQINDEYDIFIGVFWARFGSATKRDVSGTKEEFERAFNKYTHDNKSVHILMYFKKAPVLMDDIDPKQIQLINEFQKDISERGILFGTFIQANEFESLIRTHLSKLINEISVQIENEINTSSDKKSIIVLDKTDEIVEEQGYYEYIDLATNNITKMMPEMGKLTKQMADLGTRVKKRTTSLEIIKLNNNSPDVVAKQTRKTIDDAGKDLDIFNKKAAPITPILNELFNSAMTNYNKAILIHKDFFKNKEELNLALNDLIALRVGLLAAHSGTSALYTAIRDFPPLTSKLLKSKNESIKVMKQIIDEFLSYINIVDNIINVVNE